MGLYKIIALNTSVRNKRNRDSDSDSIEEEAPRNRLRHDSGQLSLLSDSGGNFTDLSCLIDANRNNSVKQGVFTNGVYYEIKNLKNRIEMNKKVASADYMVLSDRNGDRLYVGINPSTHAKIQEQRNKIAARRKVAYDRKKYQIKELSKNLRKKKEEIDRISKKINSLKEHISKMTEKNWFNIRVNLELGLADNSRSNNTMSAMEIGKMIQDEESKKQTLERECRAIAVKSKQFYPSNDSKAQLVRDSWKWTPRFPNFFATSPTFKDETRSQINDRFQKKLDEESDMDSDCEELAKLEGLDKD